MSATTSIKTRCPQCRTKYGLDASAVGRKVRCSKCQAVFRVQSPATQAPANPAGVPSEEDILRWLNEGAEDEVAVRPRIIHAGTNGAGKHDDRQPAQPARPAARETPPRRQQVVEVETTSPEPSADDSSAGRIRLEEHRQAAERQTATDQRQKNTGGAHGLRLRFRKTG